MGGHRFQTLRRSATSLRSLVPPTAWMANGGIVEKAQHIAGHESPRTTKLYDRRDDQPSLDEVEKVPSVGRRESPDQSVEESHAS